MAAHGIAARRHRLHDRAPRPPARAVPAGPAGDDFFTSSQSSNSETSPSASFGSNQVDFGGMT
ncbi:MAG: hypothetical protein AW07_03243 [Candidatus Accumulibacter sp. SK-11]|nr:MAG: hypothetical protein AW07_03243 [Candidatus Accumulibacter sp. SK-11]